MRSTCPRIEDSSPAIFATSFSLSRSRASRATCRTCSRSITRRILGVATPGGGAVAGPRSRALPIDGVWLPGQLECRAMRGPAAERFIVLSLRLMAVSFAVVGLLFIAVPNGVLDTISDLGDSLGSFTRAPHGSEE